MTHAREQERLWHGSARSSRDDDRRRRLLDAALQVYGTTGYAGATVGHVCRLAHVSTRSFYELYADQAELLTQLYRELNAEVLAGFADAQLDAGERLDRAVRTLVAAALTPMLADERKVRVLEVESVGVSPALEQERRAAYRTFAVAIDAVFAAFARAGLIAAAPGGLASLMLVGGITEALVQRTQTPPADRPGAAVFIDEVAEVIARMLGAR